jgi:hypothetical protein
VALIACRCAVAAYVHREKRRAAPPTRTAVISMVDRFMMVYLLLFQVGFHWQRGTSLSTA